LVKFLIYPTKERVNRREIKKRSEVPTAVTMKSYIFWNIRPVKADVSEEHDASIIMIVE
jgi:hypothetical protein